MGSPSMDTDKFSLRWNDFDENFKKSYRELREKDLLSDVTLATDDGQYIHAHKIILSTGSHFFNDIFAKTNNQNNMLIYLKGIKGFELEPVLDFLYYGEASISHEDLKVFLEIGKELMVKGMDGDTTSIEGSGPEDFNKCQMKEDFSTENGFNHAKSFDSSE